jgi:hypothetical protein
MLPSWRMADAAAPQVLRGVGAAVALSPSTSLVAPFRGLE